MRGSYGWDAPRVIRILFLIAILSVAAGGILFEIFDGFSAGFAWFLLWLAVATAFVCLSEACLMIHSSKKGKFKVIEHLLKDLKLKGDEECLDVGCGRGALLISLAKRLTTGKVLGIDIWRPQDQTANSPFNTMQNIHREGVDKRADVDTADARELPYGDGGFDLIVSCLTLHNLPTAADRRKALREMIRCLRPGGKIGIIDFRHAGDYRHYLEDRGLTVAHHGPSWRMFPPATTLIARKR